VNTTLAARSSIAATRWVRAATSVAVVALGIWVGGLVALGACAAPLVFGRVPAPWSGDAMGAVFRRFDAVAITCAVVVLGCEAIRLRAPSRRAAWLERARGLLSIVAALAAIYGGVMISPRIVALHAAGAVRGAGEAGLSLESLHRVAEMLGRIEVLFGVMLMVLQVVTLDDSSEGAS
jgi:hypothetical protein